MAPPLLTIGVVSCNRLFYLRALLESMRVCLPIERIECIVVDNASTEPGLRDYLESVEFVTRRIYRESRSPATEAAAALNTLIEQATATHVLLLTDDMQFIVKGDRWLKGALELASTYPQLGSIMPGALRRVTIRSLFDSSLGARLFPARIPRRLRTHGGDVGVVFYPRQEVGIARSALGITPVEVYRRLGPFATGSAAQTLQDAGGGAEDDLVGRYRRSGLRLRKALLEVPVLAEIITDPKGCQARVRGNRRYGRYLAPPSEPFYYRVWDESDARALPHRGSAIAFEDIVEPLGFDLPFDEDGNRLKNSIDSSDPFTSIDARPADTQ